MSNEYWDEDNNENEDTPASEGNPSEAIKALRKKARADAKTISELTERLDGLSKSQREIIVNRVLEKKGVNLKTARLILKDMDDVSEESVGSWLDDNAELFSFAKEPEKTQEELANEEALRAQDGLSQGAGASGSGNRVIDAFDNPNLTREQFDALIAAQQ